MRCLAIGIGAAVLLVSVSTAQAQRESGAEKVCFRREGHANQSECLIDKAAQSAIDVQKAERTFLDALAKSGNPPAEIQRASLALSASSKAYESFRQIHCDFIATLALGGNGAGDRRLLCQIELDRRRLKDLRAEVNLGF